MRFLKLLRLGFLVMILEMAIFNAEISKVDQILTAHSTASLIAYDAGAASHIAAWFSSARIGLKIYAEGPAKGVFSGAFKQEMEKSLESAITRSSVVVTGTGWASDLEHRARQLACQLSIPSVAVLDHWVNYKERFRRGSQEHLPNTIWVSDDEAFYLAQSIFPALPVVKLPNLWLQGLCNEVKARRECSGNNQQLQSRRPARRLLYLLEPIRDPWMHSSVHLPESGEFLSLRYWLKKLPNLIALGHIAPQHELEALALRLHPSETIHKYDTFIAEVSPTWPISVDRSSTLAEALAWADAVFGCETQALVAATACGLPVYSTLPPSAPPCRLPHASIQHLSRLCAFE